MTKINKVWRDFPSPIPDQHVIYFIVMEWMKWFCFKSKHFVETALSKTTHNSFLAIDVNSRFFPVYKRKKVEMNEHKFQISKMEIIINEKTKTKSFLAFNCANCSQAKLL